MVKVVTRPSVLVVGAVVGVLLGLWIIAAYESIVSRPEPVPMRFQMLDIEDVKVNPTTRAIVCKLYNRGTVDLTLTEVRVNGTIVRTGDPLPITTSPSHSYTYTFRYEGPWEGSILIEFYSSEYDRAWG